MSVRDGGVPERGSGAGARGLALGIGLAFAIGTGVYVVAYQLTTGDPSTVNREPRAIAPLVPVTSSAASGAAGPLASGAAEQEGTGPAPGLAPRPVPEPGRSATEPARPSPTLDAGDARRSSRALSAAGGPDGPGKISTSTRDTAEGSIRVSTAKADLTGRGDLLLAGDGGDGRCTKKLRFDNAGARVMPGMLLCWRTSATRSVITLAVADSGRPSTAASLAVLDREWAELG